MIWEDIVNNANLVYASTDEDRAFRAWSLKKTICKVLYYEVFPLDDIDKVICSYLKNNEGALSEEKMATILGFNVVDNFHVSPKRYADKAELEIFKAIIEPVLEWGLIDKRSEENRPTIFILTELGYRALEVGEKYRFYSGEKCLLENFNIKPVDLIENLFFPFYSALGEYTQINKKNFIPYKNVTLCDNFDFFETDIIKRHKLQSKENYLIYRSELTNHFDFSSTQVDIRLYEQHNEYYPVIFHNNQICIEATELLNRPNNTDTKEKKVEWGLYLKLIKDPDAVLDYNTIIPFEDLLEIDSLINDTRLVWSDKQLFSFIAKQEDANLWFVISNQCPIEVIKSHIDKYTDKWDWTSLSMRFDDDYLIQYATKYPWNFEAVSAKEEISIDVIKTLLLIPELKGKEWDWDSIMPQLDFEFIKSNIDKLEFELSELTKDNIEDVKPLIVQYPEKHWDWEYVSSDYDLPFILDNILYFSNFLNLINVINRVFVSENDVNQFCKSTDFKQVLSNAKELKLKNYQPNQENYFWTEELIEMLETMGYITWGSGNYILGFECNPFIAWNFDFFQKYHSKIATQKGFDFVSKHISDTLIVREFPYFNWNWNIVSANINLISDVDFLLSIKDNLNFDILFEEISGETLETIFYDINALSYLETNQELWTYVTKKSSKEFVLQHIEYNWDWTILTRRFCSTIKVDALGNPKWIDKWDWKYLTRNLDFLAITNNLDLYVEYWDWDYLSDELEIEFVLTKLTAFKEYWNWFILLKDRLDKQDLSLTNYLEEVANCIFIFDNEKNRKLWQIITRKFDYNELDVLIAQTYSQEGYNWDYSYFYDLPSFNPRGYLEANATLITKQLQNKKVKFIDWSALSGSESINKYFIWDNKLFSYKVWLKYVSDLLKFDSYQWDFKILSKLSSINWNDDILSIQAHRWDWDYLSEFSGCFRKGKDFEKRFNKFTKYINFQIFSKRKDSDITEKLLSDNLDENWDWIALSENNSIELTFKFIYDNKDKQWNWEALLNRNDITLDNETLINLSEVDWKLKWDWEAISNRKDIVFDENLIEKIINKPLNWIDVSRSDSFTPSAKSLSLLKGKLLDWDAISQNENIFTDILWNYRNKLNWKYITINEKIEISDIDFLDKYKDYLDWSFISQSDKFEVSVDNLKHFKDKLIWMIINKRLGNNVSEELLEPFNDVLDWSAISQSMNIHFTEELIEKYRTKWDWQLLRDNPQIIDRLETTLNKYQAELNCVDFLERFDGTPYIYHFTHLFNAVDIIKSRKILSRNKADGHFSNAAGNLVARRDTAHDFARFYFRPQTPTQFYNECLGWDTNLQTNWGKSYYYDAKRLGLPKCPIPVFFKFDLKKVVMTIADKCYYSTGNMQADNSKIVKVNENPDLLNTECLYYSMDEAYSYAKRHCGGTYKSPAPPYFRDLLYKYISDCKQYSQQEFLIQGEFDFSNLDSFEIICYNEEFTNLLKAQLGNDPICEKINANGWDIFHRGNRELNIDETETEISISSEYRDNAYLSIQGQGISDIKILNPENIQKETTNEILAYPTIRFTKTDKLIEVRFVDLAIGKREWLVYKN